MSVTPKQKRYPDTREICTGCNIAIATHDREKRYIDGQAFHGHCVKALNCRIGKPAPHSAYLHVAYRG